MREFGWTWEYIDDCLTLPRLYAINESWASCPPLHRMIAAFLGYGKAGRARQPDENEALASAMMMGGGRAIDDSEGDDGF